MGIDGLLVDDHVGTGARYDAGIGQQERRASGEPVNAPSLVGLDERPIRWEGVHVIQVPDGLGIDCDYYTAAARDGTPVEETDRRTTDEAVNARAACFRRADDSAIRGECVHVIECRQTLRVHRHYRTDVGYYTPVEQSQRCSASESVNTGAACLGNTNDRPVSWEGVHMVENR